MVRALIFLAVLIVLLGACTAKTANAAESPLANAFAAAGLPPPLRQPVPARDFSLPLLSIEQAAAGELLQLSDLRGKVVLLNFWATWCGPCRDEMPSMESLYNKFKDRGFEILAINCMETPADILAFKESYNFSFPVPLDIDGRMGASWGIQAIPTNFLIDKEGNIVFRLVGSIDWDTPQIHAALELLLDS